MNTPTTSTTNICLTKRQASQSQPCQSSAGSFRAKYQTDSMVNATPNKRPVKVKANVPGSGVRRIEAISKVLAVRHSATHVQPLAPSVMLSRPRLAVAAIIRSRMMSTDPWKLTPSSPLLTSYGTQSNRVSCHAWAQKSGTLILIRSAVRGHSFKVPAISKASKDRSTPSAGPETLAFSANRASACASWVRSSFQNRVAISKPTPMPKTRQRIKRAIANSAPRMLPV
ncbi:hypothetical protein D3C85_1164700 [compost metagenome]